MNHVSKNLPSSATCEIRFGGVTSIRSPMINDSPLGIGKPRTRATMASVAPGPHSILGVFLSPWSFRCSMTIQLIRFSGSVHVGHWRIDKRLVRSMHASKEKSKEKVTQNKSLLQTHAVRLVLARNKFEPAILLLQVLELTPVTRQMLLQGSSFLSDSGRVPSSVRRLYSDLRTWLYAPSAPTTISPWAVVPSANVRMTPCSSYS